MNTQQLTKIMVVFSLVGFLGLSGYILYTCFMKIEIVGEQITYIYNILNGLVGGIFALAFGLPSPPLPQGQNKLEQKIHNLSGMMSFKDKSDTWGYVYALSYMIIGFLSVCMWMFTSGGGACAYVVNFAQVFLGMMVAIVTGYFKN